MKTLKIQCQYDSICFHSALSKNSKAFKKSKLNSESAFEMKTALL